VHGTHSRAPANWTLQKVACNDELEEVLYHKAEGIAKVSAFRTDKLWAGFLGHAPGFRARGFHSLKVRHRTVQVTINRAHKHNAFTPRTVKEMISCFIDARDDISIGVVILTGAGDCAFCSGGDQHVRGEGGYVGTDGIPRLNVLDLQMHIRRLPKPVICMVAGYAVGGGHILHMVCDMTVCCPPICGSAWQMAVFLVQLC
jgi:1,4-dihydroxy-2-naphthoyl-CoA synthase